MSGKIERSIMKGTLRAYFVRVLAFCLSLTLFVTLELTARESHRALTDFVEILRLHDGHDDEFRRWRRLFAQHADELARMVCDFPIAHELDEEAVSRALTRPLSHCDTLSGRDVFAPWTNTWSGLWCNGVRQYHIWDSTRYVDGQWVQPVTLSERRFVQLSEVREKQRQGQADVAINVFSRESGITGWVSKYQKRRLEMPHIGYRINDTTLMWICQIKSPGEVFTPSNCWLVFLEIVAPGRQPAVYRIYGRSICTGKTGVFTCRPEARHFGTYYAGENPARDSKPRNEVMRFVRMNEIHT